ncbi:unknown [Bacteroides sp. CAG:462]|nr:unknown [Bacteroides sp. CAG:462]
MNRSEQEVIGTLCNTESDAVGKVLLIVCKHLLQVLDGLRCVGTSHLINDTGHSLVSIYHVVETVVQTSQLQVGNITQTENLSIGKCLDDNILKLCRTGQTSLITDGVLERLVTAFTKLTRCCLHVLLGQRRSDIAGQQLILSHHIRFQPNTHGVVGTHRIGITDTVHTFDFRNQVDTGIVLQELNVVFVLLVIKREDHQHGCLALHCRHTHLSYLGRQESLSLCHTVLHVDLCHIRVCSLLEIYCNTCRAVVCSGRLHVHHVLHTVDLVFQRRDYRVQHRLGVGTRIVCAHRDRRRRNVRILGDRQGCQAYETQDYQQD